MRTPLLAASVVLPALAALAAAQGDTSPMPEAYNVEIGSVVASPRTVGGRTGLYVTAKFTLRRPDGTVTTDVEKEEIVVEEDGKPVQAEISQPRTEKLTAMLALDISGSMAAHHKLDEAKKAAGLFLNSLHERADTGLVLFDHEMRVREEPGRDATKFRQHREEVRRLIEAAKPSGGTAYLDAAALSLQMVKPYPGRKAVVLMTDGVDMSSKRTLKQVIDEGRALGVPVYTVGIGEPGRNETVTTVLVLDHSGSMTAKASNKDQLSKIEALKSAASRFIELMPSGARTTLLPFSSEVETPQPFSDDKAGLKERIKGLRPEGGTLLYDATYAGIETVMAARVKGKKVVVVLTDGKDESPGSRVSDQVVIDRALEAGVPLYMLGLGRAEEVNEAVMQKMASRTGGKYRHAGNQQELINLFEELSIDLHDDGIDEASLRQLADQTGGHYYHVKDVSKLGAAFSQLSTDLQSTYTATWPSRRPSHDGTARGIDISVVRGGVRVSSGGQADYNVRGVVVPEMDYRVYLVLLALLAGLLAAPAGLRRLHRHYGGA
jgi:VWFA-related protein